MSPQCLNCGSHVTNEFARVMGDNDGHVHACVNCSDNHPGEAVAGVNTLKYTGVAIRG